MLLYPDDLGSIGMGRHKGVPYGLSSTPTRSLPLVGLRRSLAGFLVQTHANETVPDHAVPLTAGPLIGGPTHGTPTLGETR